MVELFNSVISLIFLFFLCGGDHVFASSRWEILKNFPRSFLSRRSRSANHFQLIKFFSVSTLHHRILYPAAVFLTVCNDFPGWVFPFPFWGFLNFTTHFLPLLFSGLFLFSTNIRVTDPRFPFFLPPRESGFSFKGCDTTNVNNTQSKFVNTVARGANPTRG